MWEVNLMNRMNPVVQLSIVAVAVLGLAACESGSSMTGSSEPSEPSFGFGADGEPAAEQFEVCKFGSSGTFTATVESGDAAFLISSPFTLADGECVVAAEAGGTGATIQVTETSSEVGFQFDHVDVTLSTGIADHSTGDPVSTTSNTLTTPQVTEEVTGTAGTPSLQGVLAEFYNVPVPTTGGEGCTPGYWRQPHHADSYPSGVNPSDPLTGVFTIPVSLTLQRPEHSTDPEDLSLNDALTLRGGGVNALLRHAVAAWLNAGTVNYPMSQGEVETLVNGALESGEYESAKDTLAGHNEDNECPLN